jgi:hypothetical protein
MRSRFPTTRPGPSNVPSGGLGPHSDENGVEHFSRSFNCAAASICLATIHPC